MEREVWKPELCRGEDWAAGLGETGARRTTVLVEVGRLGDGVAPCLVVGLKLGLEVGRLEMEGAADGLDRRGWPGERKMLNGWGVAGCLGVEVTGAGGDRGLGALGPVACGLGEAADEVTGRGVEVTGLAADLTG